MKRYTVTENEVRANLNSYNEEMLAEINKEQLFQFLKTRLANGVPTSLADVDAAFLDQAPMINPQINTFQLIKEFPSLALSEECITDLDYGAEFEIILLRNEGTWSIISSDGLEF